MKEVLQTQVLPILIQAGAVGIALALIFLLYYVIRLFNGMQERMNEVIEKNSDAHIKHAEAAGKMTEAVRNLGEIIKHGA